jgi:aminodeoxyfutalosine deaminase
VTAEREWLRGLPKAELHVHLEGTITPETFRRIARRNGEQAPNDTSRLFQCADFESFLKAFTRVAQTLREPDDFAEITSEYLSASATEGVRHVEVFFSPATVRYFHPNADLAKIVEAIYLAAERARNTLGITSLLIFDMVRNLGEAAALADIDLAQQCSSWGVIGVGLGGDERKFPARDFYKPFARAAKLGLRRTAHAGEAAGAESVRDAIELLGAERIGHGVAAARDAALLELIAQRGVAIDSCLTSNRITGASPEETEHPLKDFLARGISVTLNSDDPAFFGATLLAEFELAAKHGLTRADLTTLARNSFRCSFAPESAKRAWLAELESYLGVPGTTR